MCVYIVQASSHMKLSKVSLIFVLHSRCRGELEVEIVFYREGMSTEL